MSRDVNEGLQAGVTALSTSNIRYAHRFYVLYASYFQQLAEQMTRIPWGHHLLIIDKCHACPEKAYFYVLPTQAQLAKCYADAEAKFAAPAIKTKKGKVTK